MRIKLLAVSMLISSATCAQETLGKVDWEYAYADLHTSCNRYYSLYPPSVKCIDDRLYAVRYKISYVYRDEHREIYLSYIPDANTRIDSNGNPEPRNHEVNERY